MMTEQDLWISVDLTGAEAGTASYKATAYVAAHLSDSAGVVGIYDVKATVQ